jgi:hypothetical protein
MASTERPAENLKSLREADGQTGLSPDFNILYNS